MTNLSFADRLRQTVAVAGTTQPPAMSNITAPRRFDGAVSRFDVLSSAELELAKRRAAEAAAARPEVADRPWSGPDFSEHECLIGPEIDVDPDSDEESERILASFRSRQAAAKAEAEAERKAEEAALAAALPAQPHWGAAVRAAARHKALMRASAAGGAVHALRGIARALSLGQVGVAEPSDSPLTDPDWLWLFHNWRERRLLGAVPTEAGLNAFARCAIKACMRRMWPATRATHACHARA